MSPLESQVFPSHKPRAIICDIDNTICVSLVQPIDIAGKVLLQVSSSIEIHYVTGRPEELRQETEQFLEQHGFPGKRNLHLREMGLWQSPLEHKKEVMGRLAKEYTVIVSIGDSEEDEVASHAARIPFIRICDDRMEEAWDEVVRLISLTELNS